MPKRSQLPGLAAWAGAFLALWLLLGWIALQLPTLPDTDSYYHLGVARLYAQEGVVDSLEWTRFSVLGDGFGDKELLFHLALAPFAGDSTGGRWALAFWNALAMVVLVAATRRSGASWAVSCLVPALLWLGSLDFLGRLVRLRPETPALLLFVAAALCAGGRRYRLLGVVAFVFTLIYTAFHALLGLCLLWFLWQAWHDRDSGRGMPWRGLPWNSLAYPALGTGLALIVHPHFPHNLVLWKVQSLDFFRLRDQLDVGVEIGAQATDQMLLQNLPWLLGCLVLLAACFGRGLEEDQHDSEISCNVRMTADVLTIAALCFAVLFLLMMRFSTHALPLLTLALVFRLAASGRRSGRAVRLPGGVRLPTVALLAVVLAVGAWRSFTLLHGMATAGEREPEWRSFAAAVPDDARVVAPWGQTPIYLFFAPWARYLNALDPVFMAVPYPDLFRLQRGIFDGAEPDVPLAVVAGLDSDHLAVSRFLAPPDLLARLSADPRARPVYAGWTLLYAFGPLSADDAERFVTDWRLVPEGRQLPVMSPDDADADWPAYPLSEDPQLRRLEAYVDGRRVERSGRCFAATAVHELTGSGSTRWELAPAGPTTLWYQVGERSPEAFRVLGSTGAILGRGVQFQIGEGKAVHFSVLACGAEGAGSVTAPGFYLRRLP